jgi:TolA-binding protein
MTTISDEAEKARMLDSVTEVIRAGAERRTSEDLAPGLNMLFARVAAGRTQRRRIIRSAVVGATAVACALVGLRIISSSRQPLRAPEPSALIYQIEGGSVLEGGYLHESGHTGIKLFFNEGSKFVLMPGTRGRLRAVDREGARLAIENGVASFQVMPSHDRRWLVEVGPFLVTVKGTVFTVSWDPSSERFELGLRRGFVVVSGPVSGGNISLRAGQRLVVNLSKAEALITQEKPDEKAEKKPDEKPEERPQEAIPGSVRAPASRAVSPSALRPSAAALPPTLAKIEGERRWADDLASGHWDSILEHVERSGTRAVLDRASDEDLFALANAARYRRRMDLARAALLAERSRFPSSPRALDAIFLLGRVEESDERGRTRAIAWYDDYLARAPMGAYAAEALGRKMTLANEVGGPQKARPIAEAYLRLFPKGSYSGAARALLRIP